MITHERALEAAQRLINSHFGNKDQARASIPADPERDDDLVLTDYINQQARIAAQQIAPPMSWTCGNLRGPCLTPADCRGYSRCNAASPTLPAKYDDVLLPFLDRMRAELHANAHKGDRQGWLEMSPQQALLEIYHHVAKLQRAVHADQGMLIREHSADVANMAMMLADVCGQMSADSTAPVGDASPTDQRRDLMFALSRISALTGEYRMGGPSLGEATLQMVHEISQGAMDAIPFPQGSDPVCHSEPSAELIDHCAQRLVSWESDFCVWPDSWDAKDVRAARRDAEKVLRAAFARCYLVPANPADPLHREQIETGKVDAPYDLDFRLEHRGGIWVIAFDEGACRGATSAEAAMWRALAKPRPAQKETAQVYGIIDPDYGRAYTMIRKLAWDEGYAIGLHGSFTRDLDLVAVPWTNKPGDPEHLIRRILAATGMQSLPGNPGKKPQGRLVWTLMFPDFGDPRFIDLSIVAIALSADEPTALDDLRLSFAEIVEERNHLRSSAAETARASGRLASECLQVLEMVDTNYRVLDGEKRKAWDGAFVKHRVREILAAFQLEGMKG